MLVLLGLMLVCIFMLFRNEYVYEMQKRLSDAIHKKNMVDLDIAANGGLKTLVEYVPISYDSIESPYISLFRFWDWDHRNMIPQNIWIEIEEFYQ